MNQSKDLLSLVSILHEVLLFSWVIFVNSIPIAFEGFFMFDSPSTSNK